MAKVAKAAGVPRFLFSSSCSLYGAAGDKPVDETGQVQSGDPVRREQGDGRAGTRRTRRRRLQPYLPAQRHRVRLLASAAGRHRGEQPDWNRLHPGQRTAAVRRQPWRPLVHVEDISRAFAALLEAPREVVHDEAFNVGRDEDVVQIRTIAEQVSEITGAPVSFAEGAGPDTRNYQVDFTKIRRRFQPSSRSGRSPRGSRRSGATQASAA